MNNKPNLHRIYVEPCHYMVGEIIDDEIHVHDIVHNGQSYVAMTGVRPQLTPIPLAELTERGFEYTIEDAVPGDAEP